MQETWAQSPGREDPLKEGTVTHSSILAWRILWTEKPGGLQSIGSHWDARDVGPSLAGMLLRFIIAASILPTVKGVLDSS